MNGCEECRLRAQIAARQNEENEHLREVNRTLRAEVVASENHTETVTAMLIAEVTGANK